MSLRAPVRAILCPVAALSLGVAFLSSPASAAPVAMADPSCPTTIDESAFASSQELRDLTAKIAGFGLRNPGSSEHDQMIDWVQQELSAIPGMQVQTQTKTLTRWQPLVKSATQGRDLAASGSLKVQGARGFARMPIATSVPFSLPTTKAGQRGKLVYIPADQPITKAKAKGKIVVRPLAHTTFPYALFQSIAHYLTPDVPATGNYDRPYLRAMDPALTEAGLAKAKGLIFVWDVPQSQVKGYWDPHSGTKFWVPSVAVGQSQGKRLQKLAKQGRSARIAVRAKWDTTPSRTVRATLPGKSTTRLIVNTHTDGNTWVQENGAAGAIALARYFATVQQECRNYTVEFALTTAHLAYYQDSTLDVASELSAEYESGSVGMVLAMEHMGTREILPQGKRNRLTFTGEGEPIAWSVGSESPALITASVEAVQRRNLDRTAVIKGVGIPKATAPSICSFGGIGGSFHSRLVPTVANITGPWSLWAPGFGESAIDFDRMRKEVLASGDVLRAIDGLTREEIAGEYIAERQAVANGTISPCPQNRPPAVAPKK